MKTLRKLLAVGAIVITGGVVVWNFPDNGPVCLEYKDDVCIDERTQDEVCKDLVGEFIAAEKNMCSETPDRRVAKLTPQDYAVWKVIQDVGCPAPNGEYDISKLIVSTEYVYCDETAKDKRKDELAGIVNDGPLSWVEKREAIGILHVEGNPVIFQGAITDDTLRDALN